MGNYNVPNKSPIQLRAAHVFLPWMANSWGWGLLNCQIPRDGEGKRRQMARPPSTLQHFALIEQSSSTILRGSLPKSVPLDFGLEKTFAS